MHLAPQLEAKRFLLAGLGRWCDGRLPAKTGGASNTLLDVVGVLRRGRGSGRVNVEMRVRVELEDEVRDVLDLEVEKRRHGMEKM